MMCSRVEAHIFPHKHIELFQNYFLKRCSFPNGITLEPYQLAMYEQVCISGLILYSDDVFVYLYANATLSLLLYL